MPAPAPTLARFNPAQPGARGMKIAATGLLVFMAAVFFTARHFEPAYPALGYVKAFAEAMDMTVEAGNRDDGPGAAFTLIFPPALIVRDLKPESLA